MKKYLLALALLVLCHGVSWAQKTVLPCSQGASGPCVVASSTNPIPVGVYGGGSATSGFVLTSNGPNTLASFQAAGGGGSGTVASSTIGQVPVYTAATIVTGAAAMTYASGVLTLGTATSVLGSVVLSGSTSGTTTLNPNVAASGTLTLPAATDTLIGKATTDTLTNKTYDTAGTGNSFSINGVAATANTGTGAVARATSPTFVTPTLGAATATTVNGNTFTTGTYTLTGVAGKTLTFNNSLTLTGTDATTMTFPTTTATIARTDAGQTFTGTQAFGAITYTTLNGNTWASGTGTLFIAGGKTLTSSNTLTLAGTDSTTMTFPATSDSVAVLGINQTYTKAQRVTPVTVAISTATFTPDFNASNNHNITLVHASCPCTLANPTNISAGQSGQIVINQSSSGSDTITTYGGDYVFANNTTPTLSTGVSATDILSYYVIDSTHIRISPVISTPLATIGSAAGTPTCGTGCSSVTAGSTNSRGSLTTGSSVSAITLNWSGTLSSAPFCTISDSSTAAVADISTLSTSVMTVSVASAVTSITVYWVCSQ